MRDMCTYPQRFINGFLESLSAFIAGVRTQADKANACRSMITSQKDRPVANNKALGTWAKNKGRLQAQDG